MNDKPNNGLRDNEPSRARGPHLIAQRGNSFDHIENTLTAISSALELGARSVFIDVHLTTDSTPVAVREMSPHLSFEDNQALPTLNSTEVDALKLIAQTRQGPRTLEIGIPHLSQVSTLIDGYPNTHLLLHLQQGSLQRYNRMAVIEAVCKAMRANIERIIWITGDLPAIDLLRTHRHEPVGWVVPEYTRLSALKCEALAPDYLVCDRLLLPQGDQRLWKGPWRWVIDNVSTLTDAAALGARGAQYVITPQIRSLLREQRHERMRS